MHYSCLKKKISIYSFQNTILHFYWPSQNLNVRSQFIWQTNSTCVVDKRIKTDILTIILIVGLIYTLYVNNHFLVLVVEFYRNLYTYLSRNRCWSKSLDPALPPLRMSTHPNSHNLKKISIQLIWCNRFISNSLQDGFVHEFNDH